MRGLTRRLEALEGRRVAGPYADLSDAELEARYADVRAQIEAHGVVFPAHYEEMPWRWQQAWLRDLIGRTAP